MTPPDVSRATGVSLATIYRHLERGVLEGYFNGTRWYIAPDECILWSSYLYKKGRHVQYPPPYAQRFIEYFNLK